MIEAKQQKFYFELNSYPKRPHLNDVRKIDHLISLAEELQGNELAKLETSQATLKAFLEQHRERIDALRKQFAQSKGVGKGR